MIDKVNKLTAGWGNSNISKAGKSVLINRVLLATPIQYLSVYPIPNCVLEKISSSTRRFLWAKDRDSSGIPLINWNYTTLAKPEGGLGLRDLHLVKLSLMAKNAFNFLNSKQAIWVDILKQKYGNFNFWIHSTPPLCSCFFRGLCTTAMEINSNLWIKSINPNKISILNDPWFF